MGLRVTVILWAICYMLLALLLIKVTKAEDVIIRGGTAMIDGKPSGESKYFGVRSEFQQLGSIATATELGGFVDNRDGNFKGSMLGKLQIGVTPGPDVGVFASMFTGPCLISHTDSMLGGHFQFCSDIGLGVRDNTTLVRVSYSHVSSAGISRPNKGRDFVVGEMGIRF